MGGGKWADAMIRRDAKAAVRVMGTWATDVGLSVSNNRPRARKSSVKVDRVESC